MDDLKKKFGTMLAGNTPTPVENGRLYKLLEITADTKKLIKEGRDRGILCQYSNDKEQRQTLEELSKKYGGYTVYILNTQPNLGLCGPIADQRRAAWRRAARQSPPVLPPRNQAQYLDVVPEASRASFNEEYLDVAPEASRASFGEEYLDVAPEASEGSYGAPKPFVSPTSPQDHVALEDIYATARGGSKKKKYRRKNNRKTRKKTKNY